MTTPKKRPLPRSRRAFMKLLAAGSAAALAAPMPVVAAVTKPAPGAKPAVPAARVRRPRAGEPAPHPMIESELEKQKQYTAETVKAIRDYRLPPGSNPAFVFRPLAAKRSPRGGR